MRDCWIPVLAVLPGLACTNGFDRDSFEFFSYERPGSLRDYLGTDACLWMQPPEGLAEIRRLQA